MSSSNNVVNWFLNREDFISRDLEFFTEIWTMSENLIITGSDYEVVTNALNNRKIRSIPSYTVERRALDELFIGFDYDMEASMPIGLICVATASDNEKFVAAKVTFTNEWRETNIKFHTLFKMHIPYMLVNDVSKVYPNISLYSKKSIAPPIGEELVSIDEHHHDVYTKKASSTSMTGRKILSATYGAQASVSTALTSEVAGEVGTYATDNTATNIVGYKIEDDSKLEDLLESDLPSRIIQDPDLLAEVVEDFVTKNNCVQLLGHSLAEKKVENITTNSNFRMLAVNSDATDRELLSISLPTFRNWLVKHYTLTSSDTAYEADTVISDLHSGKSFTLNFTKTSQLAFVKNMNALGTGVNGVIKITVNLSGTYFTELSLLPRHTIRIVSVIEGSTRSVFYETNSILEKMYPIGSYYWTQNNWDPKYLFGGSWVKPTEVQGRFLYAINHQNVYGTKTGGYPVVRLDVGHLPSHKHTQSHAHIWRKFRDNGSPEHSYYMRGTPVPQTHTVGYGSNERTELVSGTGGNYGFMFRSTAAGGTRLGLRGIGSSYTPTNPCYTTSYSGNYPHNNMPPYIVAYCWRRDA
jgi:hypothetical protein